MNFSPNQKLGQNRPSLLPTNNQEKFPTIKILSSLEDNEQPMRVKASIRKKLMIYSLIGIMATFAITLFLFLSHPKNVLPYSETPVSGSNAPEKASSKNLVASSDIAQTSVFHTITEISTVSPHVSENDHSALPPSALLVDDLNEKWEVKKSDDVTDGAGINSSNINNVASKSRAPGKRPRDLSQQIALNKSREISSPNTNEAKKNRGILTPATAKKIPAQEDKSRNKTEDSDIVLLSALLANASKGSVLTSRNRQSESAMNSTDKKRSGINNDNVDIVEYHSGDDTKKLLLQCEKLGGIEATLCKDRACSNAGEEKNGCPIPKG